MKNLKEGILKNSGITIKPVDPPKPPEDIKKTEEVKK